MTAERVPLYVRLPREQADELDRLVDSTGRRKQQLVSDLLADRLEMGRLEIREDREPADAVLTLDEVAKLLRLPSDSVLAAAEEGALPGRDIGGEWRFSRSTVMRWLAGDSRAGGVGKDTMPMPSAVE